MKSSDTYDDPNLPPLSPDEEATMQAEIEIALEPYRKIAPPSMLPILRETLEHALRTHPVPRLYLRAFASRTPSDVSNEGARDGSVGDDGVSEKHA